tara:strand:- start:159 stop:371 length:213 start_codon:yes stop_codon:yes gene_type:complete
MRFEYKNEIENAYKFWEIKAVDRKVIIKYGRIGIKNPASNEKNFTNNDAAQIYLKNKINEKTKKGYVRIN